MPTEFRKKLWIALAERYMHIKRINLDMRAVLSDKWTSDDELELADQIVKDLHRTGSSFCSGTINQAKLKRVLVGYARWNKEVGYCQVRRTLKTFSLDSFCSQILSSFTFRDSTCWEQSSFRSSTRTKRLQSK